MVVLGLLAIGFGILSWIFSILTLYGLPQPAYIIVAGLLLIIFTVIAAKMLDEK